MNSVWSLSHARKTKETKQGNITIIIQLVPKDCIHPKRGHRNGEHQVWESGEPAEMAKT